MSNVLKTLLVVILLVVTPGAFADRWKKMSHEEQMVEVWEAINKMKEVDPGLSRFFNESVGYAIFPRVGKGGIGIGGARGHGKVISGGDVIGNCTLNQVTVGLQFGGQAYRELIFFETQEALNKFVAGKVEFGGNVSAVALKYGASKDGSFRDGMAVFTMAKGGLMYQATIGGQKFSYEPL